MVGTEDAMHTWTSPAWSIWKVLLGAKYFLIKFQFIEHKTTHFKVNSSMTLVSPHYGATTALILFQNSLITTKETWFMKQSPPSPVPGNPQPVVCLCGLFLGNISEYSNNSIFQTGGKKPASMLQIN